MDRTAGMRRGTWLGLVLAVAALAPLRAAADDCADGDATILISPAVPVAGEPLRVLAASDAGAIGDVVVRDAGGKPVATAIERFGGPPWSGVVAVPAPVGGTHEVQVVRDGRVVGCRRFAVEPARGRGAAPTLARWNRDSEALYAAWIEHLFDAPPDASLGFDSLQEVLRDAERNLLHGHLGLGEDDDPRALGDPPDCADLAYVLRAYFGWKTGLPLGFRPCSRGSMAGTPSCGALRIEDPERGAAARGWYARVSRRVMDTVHSGSARTGLHDEDTDFYPVPLTRAALRPGTLFADPYGHTLMIVKWVPQTLMRSGMLLAVDAQPDNSVARKRFWEGTFLFADVPSAGPGFKTFRPLAARGGGLTALPNAALTDDSEFTPFSNEQALLGPDEFYARVGKLINPDGLRPLEAYGETLEALVEQLETRVDSVNRGEDYVRAHPGSPMAMPDGPAIFETVGPWEDFATPSRDLRLQIAMNVLLELPDRIVRYPELYVLDGPPEASRVAVAQEHARAVGDRAISYTRSDGSPWRLTVGELLERKRALEMAYNPNDCIEERWGAARGSAEHATCRRHAPAEQRRKMETYREWFREGRRPTR